MSSIINVEVDLNKAFGSAIVTNPQTGEKWVNLTALQGSHIFQLTNSGATKLKLVVGRRQQVSQYGHTHSVSLQRSQEERQNSAPIVYCGDGKEFVFNNQPPAQAAPQQAAPVYPPAQAAPFLQQQAAPVYPPTQAAPQQAAPVNNEYYKDRLPF